MLGLDNTEARITSGTNAHNILRSYGRAYGLEVRGIGGYNPNRMTPWVTDMVLATYANGYGWFQ